MKLCKEMIKNLSITLNKNVSCFELWNIHKDYERFEVLTVVVMKSYIFWNTIPCSQLKINRRFRGTCRFLLQGRRINRERNLCESR
jgi:hypothetical protein